MKNLIRNLVNIARQFTSTDFAVFKICLLSIGILFGAYFSMFFMNNIIWIWVIAVITWLVLVIRIIELYKKPKA